MGLTFLPCTGSTGGSQHQETISPCDLDLMLHYFPPISPVVPQLTPSSSEVQALGASHNSGPHSPPSFSNKPSVASLSPLICDSPICVPRSAFHLPSSSGVHEHLRRTCQHHKLHASERNHSHYSHYTNTLTRFDHPSSNAGSYSFVHSTMTYTVCVISYILHSQP